MRIVFAIALLSVVAQSVTLEGPFGSGYLTQSRLGSQSAADVHKASVASLKSKIATGLANAKKALKTAKGKAKEHIEHGVKAL